MIRIDEIYSHTFWPWIKQNLPLTRLFFMDPFGSIDPADLKNYGHDVFEHNYIFMHDQEPIHLDLHHPLFQSVQIRNRDLNHGQGATKKSIIVSERQSEFVDRICQDYDWRSFYYFFHGWAALDWYRGYDKTFLMADPEQRQITTTFIAPNRIIGGKRDHRVLWMYHILKHNLGHNEISFPAICPVEQTSVIDIATTWSEHYPDIMDVFVRANLPKYISGENSHPMHSCWLSLFDQCARSLCYIINETVYFGRRHHLTEKTFKPICLRMPFVMVSSAGSLAYLRDYGFRTFSHLWDESYDSETDDLARMKKIADVIRNLDALTNREKQDLYERALPVIEHNYQHFYGGNFENTLWQELCGMLTEMQTYNGA